MTIKKLRIERRGGFAGLPAVGEREFHELSPAQQDALHRLLAAPPSPAPSPGADRFHYDVHVVDDTGTRELKVPEHAMPAELASIPKIQL
ncbi:MAG TPA: protealysin inhibitor emfourin [Xanthobacteraceae bacterium]|nr:protealysin inhibitor emfourin [Xanthobacteraceae bacterium]